VRSRVWQLLELTVAGLYLKTCVILAVSDVSLPRYPRNHWYKNKKQQFDDFDVKLKTVFLEQFAVVVRRFPIVSSEANISD
jgi:hypothetical protein